jgi:predicted TIM-barrel fold metal-dependent hydrolase
MAEIPFVDTHLHFWDLAHGSLRYDWLAPEALDGTGACSGARGEETYSADGESGLDPVEGAH